jgi:hypothetical protein
MSKFKGNYFSAEKGYVSVRHYDVEETKTDETAKVAVTGNNHHVFVIDVSGSMYYVIDDLAMRFISTCKEKLIKGDTLTLILFNHETDLVFKQFLITEDVSDYIERTSKKKFFARGLTGFANPINQLIDDDILVMMTDYKEIPIKLYFMSDGHDNKSGGLDNILKAFSRIKGFIKTGNTHVEGFGEWYDKDTLNAIAQHMSGIFVHTENVDDYIDSVSEFIDDREKGAQTKVSIPDYGELTFVLNKDTGAIIMLEPGVKEFQISATNFLVVTYGLNRPSDLKKISTLDENALQAAYAVSIQASRFNKLDLGLSILSDNVKDKFFAEILSVAQTDNLMAVAENQILSAITNADVRYQDGKGKFLKDPNKDDIAEIVFLIAKHGAQIQKPVFYNPISLRPVYPKNQANGRPYGKFISSDSDWVNFNENSVKFDVSNSTCNLSIQYLEKGYVEINSEDVLEHNLQPKVKDVVKFTNYNLFDSKGTFRFKDKKGVNAIFIKNISQELYDELRKRKAIHGSASYAPDKVFRIRLDRFPIIKRSKIDSISAADYGKLVAELKMMEVRNKVWNYFLKQISPESEMEARYGVEEAEALKLIAGVDGEGRYSAISKGLTKELGQEILKAMNINYSPLLPEFTTKAKKGTKKTYADLTMDEIKQLLVDAKLLNSEISLQFVGNLVYKSGDQSSSFNTVPSLTTLKSNLLTKGYFIYDYLLEKGSDVEALAQKVVDDYNKDAKTKKDLTKITKALGEKIDVEAVAAGLNRDEYLETDAGKRFLINQKLSAALKEAMAKEAGFDLDTLTIEEILASDLGKEATKSLTNLIELLLVSIFNSHAIASKNLSDEEVVHYMETLLKENKERAGEISKELFFMKLAFIIGKKGFSDQTDRFNPTPVDVVLKEGDKEFSFDFTPVIKQATIFSGKLGSILEQAGITI